jgi:hypothetical protein
MESNTIQVKNEGREEIIDRIRKSLKESGGFSFSYPLQMPQEYHEREKTKQEGWAILSSDMSMRTRSIGLLAVIYSHYWRAKDALESTKWSFQKKVHGKYCGLWAPKGYQLDFDTYACHWMWSNAERVKEQDVVSYFIDLWGYQPKQSKYMGKWFTCYSDEGML